MVQGDGELATVRVAGVVDEACGSAHVLAVDDQDLLFAVVALVGKLVKGVEVRGLARSGGGFAGVGFIVGEDFTTVSVDELTLL